MNRHRVAVCGIGMKTPAGTHVKQVMDTLLQAHPTAATVDAFVERGLPVTFACRVPEFDTEPYCSVRELRQMERAAVLAVTAAADAVDAARLHGASEPARTGVAVGIGAGGLTPTEYVMSEYGDRPAMVPAFTVPRVMASGAAARISLRLGAEGSALTYATACASGATAIGEAALKIRSGELDVVVAGGVEAAVSPVVMASFARMRAMSHRNDDPAAASRPFDADRDGFVMGEGAAFLVLERWEHAVARGADILGELLGYGSNSDAHHIVAPREDGRVAADCMRLALADAGLAPDEIGHINAHGTSTGRNDLAEARAITDCFGGDGPPVTASKGVLGHSLGAAGAMEAAVTLLSAAREQVPPVANHHRPGPGTEALDVVTAAPRHIGFMPAVSNSFGFGGHNVSLVLAPYGRPV
ncbi:3-oxoacyl-ACP synthase [Streptomyces sp. CB02923]|uniref:beta-ketoacyl-[acyl-carrier-protein] synthase family protein n=1 Tax=Streptomyces sp. CB02923 TaxID=1718985 RepID=UPI00093FA69D|nr:beta-ketoacyl-[acyl-carrier-protein] synthase family protein [Streptomyces sp. CB02923]OKI02560.1 3-oxoacyl-ACP synthase [Streptomyces sp. CB02923]